VLIHAGASVKTVQMALGHSTSTVTLNTYVGHWPDALDTTRSLIDAALRRPSTPRLRTGGMMGAQTWSVPDLFPRSWQTESLQVTGPDPANVSGSS
jgi:hypothetical protein